LSPWSPFGFSNLHVCSNPLALSPSKLFSGNHHLYTPFTTMKILGETWFCIDFVEFPSSTLIIFSHVKLSHYIQSITLGFAWIWPTWVKILALDEYIQSLHGFFKKIVCEKITRLDLTFWMKIFVDVRFFLHSFLCIDFFPHKKYEIKV